MNAIAGRRIILTGAASGIGLALTTRLAAGGAAAILAVDRDELGLRKLTEMWTAPVPLHTHAVDLATEAGGAAVFAAADTVMGGVDTYIANAGFAYYENFAGEWERLDAIFRINVYAPLYALGQMRQQHTDGTPYTVAITASAMGKLAYPGYAVYGGTKAALVRFAEAYRYEAPPHELLTMIYPIATRTAFFDRAHERTPSTWPTQTADYVADRIAAGLRAGQREIYPSRVFRLFRALQPPIPVLFPAQWIAAQQFRQWRRTHPPQV